MQRQTVDVTSPVGVTVKRVPVEMLGWLIMSGLCAFMLWKIFGSFETKLSQILVENTKQTVVLERVLEAVKHK